MGLGLTFEYVLKIEMGFYNIPIVIAFLAAILVACLQNRSRSFDEKLELMGQGVGDKNIITMLLIFLTAGAFVGVVGRSSAQSVAYFMLSIIPSQYAVVVLFVVGMVFPFANGLLTLLGKDTVTTPLMESYLFSFFYIYIIVGYLVGKGLLSKLRTWTVGIGALGTFLICCGYQLWAYEQPANYLVAYDFPLIPVCAAFVFELVRRCAHRFKKAEKPITGMSRMAFAIYFMHIIIMTDMVEVLNRFAPGLMAPVRLLVLEITSVGLSVAVILPLSKIKVLRRYLFLIK
jgi:hypothetical protein